MSLNVLQQASDTLEADTSGSFLQCAAVSLPPAARLLVYPGGRHARLVVMDLVRKNLLGRRVFVGYADDRPLGGSTDCKTLPDAMDAWRPTHVLICARRPEMGLTLAAKVRQVAPDVAVVSPRDAFIKANVPRDGAVGFDRSLADIRKATIVMCKTCNIRCSFCYQTDFTERMDPVIFEEKLLPIYPHVGLIDLVGGEVTAYRPSYPFARRIAEDYPHIALSVTTNGICFDDGWADVFCRTGGVVYNSVVASTPKTYETVTGQDKHETVMRNIERTIAIRDERNADLEVHMSMVVIPETQHEISALVKLGASMGVDTVEIGVDTLVSHLLDRDLIEQQVRWIQEHMPVRVHLDRLRMLFPDLIPDAIVTKPCTMDRDSIYVETNGDVFVCCHSHVGLGSLRTDDIETIWRSPAARAVQHDVSGGRCASCAADCIYRPATVAISG